MTKSKPQIVVMLVYKLLQQQKKLIFSVYNA